MMSSLPLKNWEEYSSSNSHLWNQPRLCLMSAAPASPDLSGECKPLKVNTSSVIPLWVGQLSQSVWLIYCNIKPALSRHWIRGFTQTSLLACTVRNALADRTARPHQNLPAAFFAWLRSISFPYWANSSGLIKIPINWRSHFWMRSCRKEEHWTVGCCVLLFPFVGGKRRWIEG